MSNDQTLKCYSDDQWWELQDDDHYEQQQLLDYQRIAPPPDPDHAGRHNAKSSTSAPQYPGIQYPTSIAISVSPDNSTKPPVQAPGQAARTKRRRGRGGTTETTTFLNSTITNFRELVQQHTGMMSTTPATTSYYYASCNQKGPVTLCFTNYSSSSSTTSESALGFNRGNQ